MCGEAWRVRALRGGAEHIFIFLPYIIIRLLHLAFCGVIKQSRRSIGLRIQCIAFVGIKIISDNVSYDTNHNKTYKVTCVLSESQIILRLIRSLIRVLVLRSMASQRLSTSSRGNEGSVQTAWQCRLI